nr:helix-turn-helix transcriptional regulator [Pseudomonas chlororaphis]
MNEPRQPGSIRHQRQHALVCNVDRCYIGRIERGEANVKVAKLYQIAESLEWDPRCLLPDSR